MLTRYRRNVAPTSAAITRDPFVNFVDRFFNDFAVPAASFETPTSSWVPAMDIVEREDAFVATADLPGLSKDDIDIALEDGVLSISGERTVLESADEHKGFRRLERAHGSFQRSFTLPQGVDIEKVDATFDQGVLTLTLPKTEIVKARKISIS
ncbi:MAG: Hsp20/alpha crystallin family protein [Acidobacteriota bacterium]